MNAYICKSCGRRQYSAANTTARCIYCGKGPIEVEPAPESVTLTLNRQTALAILHKLEAISDDAEDSYYEALERKSPELESFKGNMAVTRQQYSALRRAYQESRI